jgi:hypothetical protein
VNYALDQRAVVVRTHPGTKLSAADHANVTFEVDHIDPISRSGWSVLIRGLAEEVTSAHRTELIERTHRHRSRAVGARRARALVADHPARRQRPSHRARRAATAVRIGWLLVTV